MTNAFGGYVIIDRWVARCKCGARYSTEQFGGGSGRCECSRRLNWQRIIGHQSETKCGPRCTSAVGPSCDCQCGGSNHSIDRLGVAS